MKIKDHQKLNKYWILPEYERGCDNNCSWISGNSPRRPGKETEGNGNQRNNRYHPDHSSVKITLDTLKCPGKLRRIAIIQISVKKPRLKTGIKKTFKVDNNNNNILGNVQEI